MAIENVVHHGIPLDVGVQTKPKWFFTTVQKGYDFGDPLYRKVLELWLNDDGYLNTFKRDIWVLLVIERYCLSLIYQSVLLEYCNYTPSHGSEIYHTWSIWIWCFVTCRSPLLRS